MRVAPRPVLWCRVEAPDGSTWPVMLAVPEFCLVLARIATSRARLAYGVCDFAGRQIVINARTDEREQEATLLHELGHLALDARPRRMGLAAQHRVLGPLDAALAGLLTSAGVRFPRRPPAYRALRRWAMENAP